MSVVMMLVLLPGCNLPEAGGPGLTDDQKVTIGNLIIKELRSQDYDVVKTDPSGSKYTIRSKINSIPETMLLDSGSSFTHMDEDIKSRYLLKDIRYYNNNKPKIITIFNDVIENSFPAIADTFQVGNTVLRPWPFIVSDEFDSATILGCDFLHFTSAVFICNPGVLFITTSHTPAVRIGEILKTNGYAELDLLMVRSTECLKINKQFGNTFKTLNSGVLLVPVLVENTKGYCVIDTGAFYTSLKNSVIKKKIWQIKSYSDAYQVDAKGNESGIDTILLKSFLVGDFDLGKDIEVLYTEVKDKEHLHSKDDTMPILGNIGVDVLRRYNAIIDFGNRRLYLQR